MFFNTARYRVHSSAAFSWALMSSESRRPFASLRLFTSSVGDLGLGLNREKGSMFGGASLVPPD